MMLAYRCTRCDELVTDDAIAAHLTAHAWDDEGQDDERLSPHDSSTR